MVITTGRPYIIEVNIFKSLHEKYIQDSYRNMDTVVIYLFVHTYCNNTWYQMFYSNTDYKRIFSTKRRVLLTSWCHGRKRTTDSSDMRTSKKTVDGPRGVLVLTTTKSIPLNTYKAYIIDYSQKICVLNTSSI